MWLYEDTVVERIADMGRFEYQFEWQGPRRRRRRQCNRRTCSVLGWSVTPQFTLQLAQHWLHADPRHEQFEHETVGHGWSRSVGLPSMLPRLGLSDDVVASMYNVLSPRAWFESGFAVLMAGRTMAARIWCQRRM